MTCPAFQSEPSRVPTKLRVDKSFQPSLAEAGDELYPNGIFEFNITRLLAFIESYADRFPIELIQLADIPDYGGKEHLDEEAIRATDLSRPIRLAGVSPGRFNVIDGHHRVAKARREAACVLPALRLRCPQHVPFLTSTRAYEKYVEYWNSKL
jgi:hypothetical protein